jgi:XRE family aerobic/anaerobic benzoate catabolism transcriptional regulator
VIALPGGIVHLDGTFDLVLKHCTTIWLKARPEDHMERVLEQGDRRPVADRPNAMAELRAILAAREPLYARADLTVDTSRHDLDSAVRAVVAALARAGWATADRLHPQR